MKNGTMTKRQFKLSRLHLGLTRTELAVKLNRTEQSIYSYESGLRQITLDIEEKMNKLLADYELVFTAQKAAKETP